jgi:hypothetical protein
VQSCEISEVLRHIRTMSGVVLFRIHRLSSFNSFFWGFYLRDLLSIPMESASPMLVPYFTVYFWTIYYFVLLLWFLFILYLDYFIHLTFRTHVTRLITLNPI